MQKKIEPTQNALAVFLKRCKDVSEKYFNVFRAWIALFPFRLSAIPKSHEHFFVQIASRQTAFLFGRVAKFLAVHARYFGNGSFSM